MSLLEIPLLEIQPSQFHLCKEKLDAVECWLIPSDLRNFSPLPVKELNGRLIFTDGHSRAFAAWKAGLTHVPLVWDEDEMDWEAYQLCVDACRARGIYSVADLGSRILPEPDYRKSWNGWCDVLHEILELQRARQ